MSIGNPLTNRPISFVQANLGKGNNALSELVHYLNKEKVDIALVSEPATDPKTGLAKKIPNFTTIQSQIIEGDRIKATIYLREASHINYSQISQVCNNRLSAIELKLKDKNLIIMSAYLEPDETGDDFLVNLEMTLTHLKSPLLIGGDFNARSKEWMDHLTDDRGEALLNLILTRNLFVLNDDGRPTFMRTANNQISTSIVDLTISSLNLRDYISDWKVDFGIVASSDHNAISFKLVNQKLTKPAKKSTYKYDTKSADWELFDQELEDNISKAELSKETIEQIISKESLDEAIEKLDQCLTHTCEVSFKRKERKAFKTIWMNDTIKELKLKVKRFKNIIHRKKKKSYRITQENLDNLSKAREAYSKEISKATLQSFRDTVGNSEPRDVWEVSRKIIKLQPHRLVNSSMLFGDEWSTGEEDTARRILNHFYKDDVSELSKEIDRKYHHLKPSKEDDLAFTKEEMIERISFMSCKKAPGIDGFTADICKRLIESHSDLMLSTYNKCLTLGHFPKKWKSSVCKIIPKAGKDNYAKIESYRPLGLLPILGKILEALFIKRIKYLLKKEEILSDRQFGFTEQTSTIDALDSIITKIKKHKVNKKQVLLLSLDIQGAFDHAKWPIIMKRLYDYNIPNNLFQLVKSYLSDRESLYPVSEGYIRKATNQGCVQGSVCGPDLWNILLNDIFQIGLPQGVELSAFADDISLIISDKKTENVIKIANEALNRIFKWGCKNGLIFNANKTQCVALTNKIRKANILPKMNDQSISLSKEVKILGVYIDQYLKFNTHVLRTLEKVKNAYKNMYRISRITWGAHPEIIREIYLRAIEPALTYGCYIWQNALRYQYIKKALNTFQRSFALQISKAYRTVSLNASLVIANIPPLDLKIEQLIEITKVKREGIHEALKPFAYQKPISFKNLDHPAKRITISYKRIENQEQLEREISDPTSEVYFTDGSLIEERVGAAWGKLKGNSLSECFSSHEKLKLGDMCSVFQAELIAIRGAIKHHISSRSPNDCYICSDSLSSLIALQDRNNKNKIVNQIHQAIAKAPTSIYFLWVRAHNNILGNEQVDLLAKEAALSDSLRIFDDYPLSRIKALTKKEMLEKWNERYLAAETGSHTREYIKDVYMAQKLWDTCKPNFYTTQALTGHGCFRAYLKRFMVLDNPFCLCDPLLPQTAKHLIEECPIFLIERMRYRFKAHEELNKENNIKQVTNIMKEFSAYLKNITKVITKINKTNRISNN